MAHMISTDCSYSNCIMIAKLLLYSCIDGLREEDDSDTLMYYTEEAPWFNRTVLLNEYYFCHRCKTITFSSQSGACRDNTSCSYVTLAKAVIFLGNYDNVMPSSKFFCILIKLCSTLCGRINGTAHSIIFIM